MAPRDWRRAADYADIAGMDLSALAWEFLEHTVAGRRHAFSNVTETLEEIHKGVSKAYPCGAGVGLVKSFARQAGAQFRILDGPGARFEITSA